MCCSVPSTDVEMTVSAKDNLDGTSCTGTIMSCSAIKFLGHVDKDGIWPAKKVDGTTAVAAPCTST